MELVNDRETYVDLDKPRASILVHCRPQPKALDESEKLEVKQ